MADERASRKLGETDASLIPEINQEEARLRAMQDEAKTEADRLIADAEREAAARIETAKREWPARMATRRKEALQRIETQARRDREAAETEAKELKQRARANMEAAVARLVSLVCPKGAP